MSRLVLLAPLVLLAVLLPAPAPAAELTMSLAPNAAFSGTVAPVTATTRGSWTPEPPAELVITPSAPEQGQSYRAPLAAHGTTGTRWEADLPLHDQAGTPAAPGLYDAQVVLGGAVVESCTRCYTVLTRSAPTVRSCADVTPRRLLRGEERTLHVGGSSFADRTVLDALAGTGTSASVLVTGSELLPLGVDTGALLTRSVRVQPDAPLGFHPLRVTNADGRTSTLQRCLAVTAPADKVEPTGATNDVSRTLVLRVPEVLPKTARLTLTWIGEGAPSPALDLLATRSVVASGPTSTITGTFSFTGATPGLNAYQAGYLLPDGSAHGCEGLCRFTVRQTTPPVITRIDGLSRGTGATRTLTVTGTGFTRGTRLETDDPDVAVLTVAFTSPTTLRVTVRVAPTVGPTPVGFSVENPDDQRTDFQAGAADPGPPAPPVAATGSPDEDPDPSRAPEQPTMRLAHASIVFEQRLGVSGRAEPGASLDLYALTRPATVPVLLRTTVVPDDGEWSFTVSPKGSSRLVAVARNTFGRTSSEVLPLQVRSAVTHSATRTGRQTYTFSGTVLPRRTAQHVRLYELRGGREVALTARVPVASDGTWRLSRRFGPARPVVVFARSTASSSNAAGASRPVRVDVR